MDDDVSIDEPREAVERLHGVRAYFIEPVDVDARFKGEVVWRFRQLSHRRAQFLPIPCRFVLTRSAPYTR